MSVYMDVIWFTLSYCKMHLNVDLLFLQGFMVTLLLITILKCPCARHWNRIVANVSVNVITSLSHIMLIVS